MTDTLTKITVPHSGYGIQEHGRVEPTTMIARIRSYAKHLREEADAIDSCADDEFRVEVVRGSFVQRHVTTLQEGRCHD